MDAHNAVLVQIRIFEMLTFTGIRTLAGPKRDFGADSVLHNVDLNEDVHPWIFKIFGVLKDFQFFFVVFCSSQFFAFS